jgi:hypothetical protein
MSINRTPILGLMKHVIKLNYKVVEVCVTCLDKCQTDF